jgi:hypothetical protein
LGNRQWRRVQSNTGATLTLDTTNDSAWAATPLVGETVVVGGIDWYWRAPVITFGDPFRKKKGGFIAINAKPSASVFGLRLIGFLEGLTTQTWSKVMSGFTIGSGWGVGLWGTLLWGGSDANGLKTRIMRNFFSFTFELSNPYPNQPVSVVDVRLTADGHGRRWVKSGGG